MADILKEIMQNWSLDTAENFLDDINSLIDKIQKHNHICPKSKVKNIHKCVISKHNSLLYKIESDQLLIVDVIRNKNLHHY